MTDADAICGDRQKGWSATSSRGSEAEEGELVGLKDGSSVLVRPVTSDDKPLFVARFARLGEQSRYRRFLAAKKRLSDDDLAFFTELDHHGHEALGAVDPTTGEGLAVARCSRPRTPRRRRSRDRRHRRLAKARAGHGPARASGDPRPIRERRNGPHDRSLRRHRRGRRPPPNHSRRAIPANGVPAHRREQTGRDLTEHVGQLGQVHWWSSGGSPP
jgi:hypothetical protein